MSAAPNNVQSVIGNTARALSGIAAPSRPAPKRSRTPLSVVQSAPRRRRTPFVLFCFGVLAAALMTVLVLNISVSSGQYELVQLRSEQAGLLRHNQELTQKVQNFEAPQNLAAKAAELGMVAATTKGQIDLKSMKVSGTPKPAEKADKPGAAIAAPSVSGAAPAQAASSDQQEATPLPQPVAAKPKAAAASPSTPELPSQAAVPSQAAAPPLPAAGVRSGTIPAPGQKPEQ